MIEMWFKLVTFFNFFFSGSSDEGAGEEDMQDLSEEIDDALAVMTEVD